MFSAILFYPLKIIWNGLVIGLMIWAFIAWWGLIFGSIVAIVLIIIFGAYDILILPIAILGLYSFFVPDDITHESERTTVHLVGLGFTAFIIYILVSQG